MNIIYSLILILLLNGILFMADQTMQNTNPDTTLYNYDDSLINEFNSGTNGDYALSDGLNGSLPSRQNAIDTSGSAAYTDTFATSSDWINNIPVFGTLWKILTGFHSVISMLHIPSALVYMIDFIWYGFNVLLLFMFVRGD